eukprot:scaffold58451_cov70-Phaeocystis_antarctica.AAC.5
MPGDPVLAVHLVHRTLRGGPVVHSVGAARTVPAMRPNRGPRPRAQWWREPTKLLGHVGDPAAGVEVCGSAVAWRRATQLPNRCARAGAVCTVGHQTGRSRKCHGREARRKPQAHAAACCRVLAQVNSQHPLALPSSAYPSQRAVAQLHLGERVGRARAWPRQDGALRKPADSKAGCVALRSAWRGFHGDIRVTLALADLRSSRASTRVALKLKGIVSE